MINLYKSIFRFSQLSSFNALSPLDGRYISKTNILQPYFSQAALMKYRTIVQSKWLIHLLQQKIINIEAGTTLPQTIKQLQLLISNFNDKSASRIKDIQKTTNHDLKSVQYFIKENITHHKEHIHFCCTSQDINNLSYSLMLRDALQQILIPQLTNVLNTIINKAENWQGDVMMARTHGQPASPTTLGKQYANFAYRIALKIADIKKISIYGKFNGAVGNYNAHTFVYPQYNWISINKRFVQDRLGLKFNPYTTQIQPHDSLSKVFTQVSSINTILIGLCRDTWQYISKGFITQKTKQGQIGSSTMPHKVNPIDFQNSQGNLGMSNAVSDHLKNKLPISRQQRDLSDSTVLRNQGVSLGYSVIAYDSLIKGMAKIQSNPKAMKQQLSKHMQVVTQAIQTQLRKVNYPQPYQLLKKLSRGTEFNLQALRTLTEQLSGKIPAESLDKISKIRPQLYIGEAKALAKQIRQVCGQILKQ